MNVDDAPLTCRNCGSTQLHAEKRGYTFTRGALGSSEILITCLKCGRKAPPGGTSLEQLGSALGSSIAREAKAAQDRAMELQRLKGIAEETGEQADRDRYESARLWDKAKSIGDGVFVAVFIAFMIWFVFFGGWWKLLNFAVTRQWE